MKQIDHAKCHFVLFFASFFIKLITKVNFIDLPLDLSCYFLCYFINYKFFIDTYSIVVFKKRSFEMCRDLPDFALDVFFERRFQQIYVSKLTFYHFILITYLDINFVHKLLLSLYQSISFLNVIFQLL